MLYDLDSNQQLFPTLEDAVDQLLEVLPTQRMKDEEWIIVAISSQGLIMAEYMAKKLNLSYDLLFSEPILAPNNNECAIARVSECEEIVIHEELVDAFDIKIEYIYGEAHRKYEEKILKNVYKYKKGELINSLKDSRILLIDEGCESGLTVLTAIKTAMKEETKSVAFATPLIPLNLENKLENITDEFYTLHHIENFVEVKFYYENWESVTSDMIVYTIENSEHYLPFRKINIGEKEE